MTKDSLVVVGWREWLSLPDLGIGLIKAKIDTGARTSSLHAEEIETFRQGKKTMVRFVVHPLQRDRKRTMEAQGHLVDERSVRSSNGVLQVRPVIETSILLAGQSWPIEVTLTSRDAMGFRMLLGRQAVRGHALVDPGRSFLTRKHAEKQRKKRTS